MRSKPSVSQGTSSAPDERQPEEHTLKHRILSFHTAVQILRSPRKMEPCFPFSLPVLPFKGNGGDSWGSQGINWAAEPLPTWADGAAQDQGGDEGEVWNITVLMHNSEKIQIIKMITYISK